MVNREELYRLIDAVPDQELPRIKALLEPIIQHKQPAVAQLLALLEKGYPLGTQGRSPYHDRDELHDR
jgi:hypothetical protein